MPLRNNLPVKFKPQTVCDTWDGMNVTPGAMSSLSNLIPDPSTPMAFQCRPAASVITTFPSGSFPGAGTVSVAFEINNRVYGLISSTLHAGYDQPFSYNLIANTFDTITGITSSNVPTTQATTGAWTPPAVAVMGPYVIFTHPGFNGSGNGYFGYFNITNPSSPAWASGNTTGNGLTGVPTDVQLFYNRLYFAVGNTLQFTDTLSLNRTNTSQSLTAGDTSSITALSLFTLTTTTQGILQGLLAFKSNTVFQVTGDSSANTLAINSLNTAAGTIAPNSVVPTPDGVFFMAPDGIRVVQADGTVSEPDQNLRLAFLNCLYPSRVTANYNSDIYRVCVQNGGKAGSPWEEYWYDLGREIWTGPHTFQCDIALPWMSGFILFSHLNPGAMYLSYVTQVSGVGFTELGAPLSWIFQTAPMGDEDSLMVTSAVETTLNMAFITGEPPITITASDESGGVLSQATFMPPSTGSIWGAFNWGSGIWFGTQYGIRPHLIPWTNPLVFTKMVFQANGKSILGFKISNLRLMIQQLGYLPSP